MWGKSLHLPPGPGSYPFSPVARLDVDTNTTTRRTAWARRFDPRLSRELVNMCGGPLPTDRAVYMLRATENVAVGDYIVDRAGGIECLAFPNRNVVFRKCWRKRRPVLLEVLTDSPQR